MLNVYTTGLYCTGSTRKEGAFDTTHNVFKFDVSACAALTKGPFSYTANSSCFPLCPIRPLSKRKNPH